MNFLTHLNAIQQIIYVSSVMWMRFVIMAAVFVMKDSEETALSAMVSKHTLWEEENRLKKEKKKIARVRYDESMQSLSNEIFFIYYR